MMSDERPEMANFGRDSATRGRAKRDAAVLALLTERNLTAAAKRAGVGVRTLARWLSEDVEFQREVEQARAATFHAAMNRIQGLTVRAVEVLDELLESKKYPSVRLRAAQTVVEVTLYQHGVDDLMAKLNELEQLQRLRRPA